MIRRGIRALPPTLLALGWLALAGLAEASQEEARPVLEGRVVRGDADYPDVQVVLHRVSAVEAGEIDSVRTDAAGRFRFPLPSVPREDQEGDIYFASVRHDGILYFGRAVSRAVQLDSLYTVQAWDTAAAPPDGVPLPVAVRYVIAEEAADGWAITDLFEIANEGDRTWVVSGEGGSTWQHPLPVGARDFQVGGGDVSSDAARAEDGVLRLSGPISPGERQFVLRYTVDSLAGFEIPLEPGTRTVEFLVREPAPDLEVEGLPGVETVEMQPGVTFRRFAGDAPPSDRVRIQAGTAPGRLPMEHLAVVLALLLAGAGLWAVQRHPADGGGGVPVPATPEVDAREARDRLLLEVARIDERLEAEPAADDRTALEARRAELLDRLSRG